MKLIKKNAIKIESLTVENMEYLFKNGLSISIFMNDPYIKDMHDSGYDLYTVPKFIFLLSSVKNGNDQRTKEILETKDSNG